MDFKKLGSKRTNELIETELKKPASEIDADLIDSAVTFLLEKEAPGSSIVTDEDVERALSDFYSRYGKGFLKG